MPRFDKHELVLAAEDAGIFFPGAMDVLPRRQVAGKTGAEAFGDIDRMAADELFGEMFDGMSFAGAADSIVGVQPGMITTPNAGIPAFLATYIDPKVIAVLLQPMKAVEVYGGEVRKGDWVTDHAMFPMAELTGEVSSYGDFNENGRSGANYQYEDRDSYLYQTFTEWGERELDRYGLGKLDHAARLNISSANTLNRYQNLSYFYGIGNGLANYGSLNDPALSAALTPATKAAGGTGWKLALPTEILVDVQAMFVQLQQQTGSNLELDENMTLVVHSSSEAYLANTNSFGKTAMELIQRVFPNLKVKQAPQMLSGTTYSAQMFVDSMDGQQTIECGYNEKMRAHRLIPASSSYRQKKTQGTWGAIVFRPAAVVSMAGL